jgi:CRP/FNR family cyclic AMP-dependent transcriptional regulator
MRLPPVQDQSSRRIAFLRQVSIFADLREEELQSLLADFHVREYNKDEIIFRQEDTSRELYVVVKGKVRVFRISPAGSETSIQIFSTHDIIGEFAMVDARPRSATAKAIDGCTLLAMAGDRFLDHMRQMPDLALAMTTLLASKVRWTAAYAEAIAQYDAAGRLLHILLLYNEQFGEEIEPGKRYVLDLSLNQTDLASLVGARREWVNRILRSWRERGLIEYDAGKIVILDLPRVQQERDSRIEAHGTEW